MDSELNKKIKRTAKFSIDKLLEEPKFKSNIIANKSLLHNEAKSSNTNKFDIIKQISKPYDVVSYKKPTSQFIAVNGNYDFYDKKMQKKDFIHKELVDKSFPNQLRRRKNLNLLNLDFISNSVDIKDKLHEKNEFYYVRKIVDFLSNFKMKPKIISSSIGFHTISIKIVNESKIFEQIEKNKRQLIDYLDSNDVNVYYINAKKVIIIDIYLKQKSKISFKESIKNSRPLYFNLFYHYDRTPHFMNLIENNSILFYGDKGSGSSLAISNLILSLLLFQKEFKKIIIYDHNQKTLEHFKKFTNYFKNIFDLNKEIDNLLFDIKNQEKILIKNNLDDIFKYNEINKSKIKMNCLILNGINNLPQETIKKIETLTKLSKKHGIYIIIIMEQMDDELIELTSQFDIQVFFKINNIEDSIRLSNTEDLVQLRGNGDAIIYESSSSSLSRVQSLFINKRNTTELLEKVLVNENSNNTK